MGKEGDNFCNALGLAQMIADSGENSLECAFISGYNKEESLDGAWFSQSSFIGRHISVEGWLLSVQLNLQSAAAEVVNNDQCLGGAASATNILHYS